MDDARKSALIHAVLGIFPPQDVPVGTYDLAGARVVITLPEEAGVVREKGTAGNGFDDTVKELKEVPMAAIAAFLKQSGATGATKKRTWKALIKKAILTDDSPGEEMPAEALEALREIQVELKAKLSGLKKTGARRLNIKSARIEIFEPVAA